MNETEVFEKVTGIFRDVMDTDDVVLSRTTTGDDVEEWDSLSHVRLIVSIEKAFGVRFSNSEIGNFEMLGDIADAVLAKLTVS